jgi:hypothetical protein
VPTSLEAELKGNNKGTSILPTHEIEPCHVAATIQCVAPRSDLVPPFVLEDRATDLNSLCDQTIETSTILSAPIAETNCYSNLSAPDDLNVETEPCDFIVESDLDHIKLFIHDEEIARNFHNTSIWSILMDPPMCLSHDRDKISEFTCLSSFTSVYTPNFQFLLIGDYGLDNKFFVHKMCITCDRFPDLFGSGENSLNHFDMTSNIGIELMPTKLLYDNLLMHVASCNLESAKFSLPILGWCNDEHFSLRDHSNMCFIYICKMSCDACWNLTNNLRSYYGYFLCSKLNVQQGRGIKMDDIYIYHAHTLFLLLACLQNKHRRGWLHF